MRFSLKGWLLTAVVGTALWTVPLPAADPTTNVNNFRLKTPAPGFPVTTFAPYNSGLLLGPLYRAGINPFNNYGNWPLDYSPNFGYPFVYPGWPVFPPYGYPNYGSLGSININMPPSGGGAPSYPSYPPMIYSTGNPYLGASGYPQASLAANPSGGATSIDGGISPVSPSPYIPDYSPAGGFLQGVASATTSNANAQYAYQRARLVNTDVGVKSINYRRRELDEARYESMTQLDGEQRRGLNMQTALDRARHDPPLTEVWSGQSLNNLYNHLKSQQGKGLKGPTLALREDLLKRINLTPGKNGNAGLLKRDIVWPKLLLRPEFDEPRKNLDTTIPEAVRQAKIGPVNTNVANDVLNDVQKMHDILLKNIGEIRPGEYIEAKAYLNKLSNSARALQDRDVNNYFSGEWAAKGKTVGELVKNLSEKGLQFAPAAPGDEWAYRGLYNAMAAYDAGMTQTASTTTKQP